MYATDVCALEIYHRMQHIEINFYIRYIMSRHLYSTARQLLFPGGAGRIVKKIGSPKFYLGLLEIMCWEPHGLQLFKVSVDPCVYITLYFDSINHFRVCLFSPIQSLLAASAALIRRVPSRCAFHVHTTHGIPHPWTWTIDAKIFCTKRADPDGKWYVGCM